MPIEHDFWENVRKKRNLFYLWWLGWIPIGLIGAKFLKHFFGDSPYYGYGMILFWFVGWQLILAQLKALRCPRCGNRAIANPYFFMKDARCKECGLEFKHHA